MPVAIDFSGRDALVTGASRGIGAAIARALHSAGARVALNHPDAGLGPNRADAEALAAELESVRPGSTLVLAADVADPEAVRAMMSDAVAAWGGLDLLINNAGILRDRSIAKLTLDDWRAVLDVNLSGVFHGCKFGLEVLRDGGAVVNLGSLAAFEGFFGQSNYAAAKAGVHALTLVLAREAARRSIRVNAVAPGVITTSMTDALPPEVREEMLRRIPSRRFGEPEQVASVVLFLCSDLAGYVNGQTIQVNGGWRA